MGSRPSERYFNRSASHHYRLSDGIHKVPSSFTLWPCEMTDLSPTTTGFLHGTTNAHHHHHQLYQQQQQQRHHHNHHQKEQQQHLQRQHSHTSLTMIHRQSSSHSVHGSRRGSGGIRAPPAGTGRLFSYFGNEHEHEHDRKKSETSFFNLGFRRKSTVVYYAPTE